MNLKNHICRACNFILYEIEPGTIDAIKADHLNRCGTDDNVTGVINPKNDMDFQDIMHEENKQILLDVPGVN